MSSISVSAICLLCVESLDLLVHIGEEPSLRILSQLELATVFFYNVLGLVIFVHKNLIHVLAVSFDLKNANWVFVVRLVAALWGTARLLVWLILILLKWHVLTTLISILVIFLIRVLIL